MSSKYNYKYIIYMNNRLHQLWQLTVRNTKTATRLMLLFSIGLWLATNAIAPQVAQAYTARLDLSLERQAGENYDTLLRRAEAAARAAVNVVSTKIF